MVDEIDKMKIGLGWDGVGPPPRWRRLIGMSGGPLPDEDGWSACRFAPLLAPFVYLHCTNGVRCKCHFGGASQGEGRELSPFLGDEGVEFSSQWLVWRSRSFFPLGDCEAYPSGASGVSELMGWWENHSWLLTKKLIYIHIKNKLVLDFTIRLCYYIFAYLI